MDSEVVMKEVPDWERLVEVFGTPKTKKESRATVMVSPREEAAGAQALPKLDRIATLILEVDSRAISKNASEEIELRNHNRSLLAAQLGCTLEDIAAIVESYGDSWQEYILEARLESGMNSTHMRDVTWDKLEAATLNKLMIVIERAGNRLTVAELLAVAKTANTANRGDRSIKGPGQGQGGGPVPLNLQVNTFMGGDPANGVLPAGNLGTISLNLSQRVLKQLATPKEIEGESVRVLDKMEMMGIKDIQKIGEKMDKAKEEGENK